MPATFILDTSFLINLERFERHCRASNVKINRRSSNWLNHLAKPQNTLVLPTAVLRELTTNTIQRGAHFMLGRDEITQRPTLDVETLRKFQSHTVILGYIIREYQEGNLQIFESIEKFNEALEQGQLEGKLAIVAQFPLPQGKNGLRTESGRHSNRSNAEIHWASGDREITGIVRGLSPTPRNPCALITDDAELAHNVTEINPHIHTLKFPAYLHMLDQTQFFKPSMILPRAIASFNYLHSHPKEKIHPLDATLKPHVSAFMEKSGLAPQMGR